MASFRGFSYALPVVLLGMALGFNWYLGRTEPLTKLPTAKSSAFDETTAPPWTATKPAVPFTIPAFRLSDQSGHTISDADLRGSVWIASVIFTGCSDSCATVSQRMAMLQRDSAGFDIRLVSFCVDPFPLTNSLLQSYSRTFGGEDEHWSFASGNDLAARRVAAGLGAMPPLRAGARQGFDVIPRPWLFLIDRNGQVIHIYDALDRDCTEAIRNDLCTLHASEISSSN